MTTHFRFAISRRPYGATALFGALSQDCVRSRELVLGYFRWPLRGRGCAACCVSGDMGGRVWLSGMNPRPTSRALTLRASRRSFIVQSRAAPTGLPLCLGLFPRTVFALANLSWAIFGGPSGAGAALRAVFLGIWAGGLRLSGMNPRPTSRALTLRASRRSFIVQFRAAPTGLPLCLVLLPRTAFALANLSWAIFGGPSGAGAARLRRVLYF